MKSEEYQQILTSVHQSCDRSPQFHVTSQKCSHKFLLFTFIHRNSGVLRTQHTVYLHMPQEAPHGDMEADQLCSANVYEQRL